MHLHICKPTVRHCTTQMHSICASYNLSPLKARIRQHSINMNDLLFSNHQDHSFSRLSFVNGALILKQTMHHIQAKLSSLPSYLSSINFNNPEFSKNAVCLVEQLRACGSTMHNLLINQSVTNHEFVAYIKQRKQQYEAAV
jgi:hypothetical protein